MFSPATQQQCAINFNQGHFSTARLPGVRANDNVETKHTIVIQLLPSGYTMIRVLIPDTLINCT